MFRYKKYFRYLLSLILPWLLLGQMPGAAAQLLMQMDSVIQETTMDSLPGQTSGFSMGIADTTEIETIDSTGFSFPGLRSLTDSLEDHSDSTQRTANDSLHGADDRVAGFREEITQAPDIRNIISLSKIFWSIIFIVIGYFFIKAINGILSIISERNVKYKGAIRRILPVIRIVGWSLVVYIIINGIFKPPAETIFAFFASVGVAIGFASQDLLKNIFGGLMILFDKPFQIGDKIESGNYYGEVLEIGLRSTRIVTPDDSVVTIPNSEMMNQSISNANSGENNCQVVAEFFFPVTIDTKRVRQIAVEAAQISQYVYLNKPILVVFSNIVNPKGSFLKMKLKAYVNDVRYEFPFQSEMTEIVLRELNKEGLLEGL